jgi:MoxR-like ATPase
MPNLEARAKIVEALLKQKHWAFLGKVLLPAGNDSEFFVALVFSGTNLELLEQRLKEMEAAGARLNNTRFELHAQGFFVTVLGESEQVDPASNSQGYGLPVPVDEILYADVERSGRLTPGEVDVVHRLRRNYVDPGVVRRLESGGGVVVPVRRPQDLTFAELKGRIEDLGGYYADRTLEAFHLSLIHNPQKHFVILRGISGTGKSHLAKTYAYAVLAANSLDEVHDRFVTVPVEPQWTDPTFLVGYEDVLAADGYNRTAFLDALLLANSDPMQPVFVLLDEMNRAQVEHYFSNFLSAMESRTSIRFHAGNSPGVTEVPTEIPWPSNLYLIGTVNDDESVIPFSPMVLDRANSQDLSNGPGDLTSYGSWLRGNEPDLAPTLDDVLLALLEKLSQQLRPFALNFGNRTVRELALYIKSASDTGSKLDPLDHQIDQKILPKVRGGEETAQMLDELLAILRPYPISHERVSKMKADLEQVDFFKYR